MLCYCQNTVKIVIETLCGELICILSLHNNLETMCELPPQKLKQQRLQNITLVSLPILLAMTVELQEASRLESCGEKYFFHFVKYIEINLWGQASRIGIFKWSCKHTSSLQYLFCLFSHMVCQNHKFMIPHFMFVPLPFDPNCNNVLNLGTLPNRMPQNGFILCWQTRLEKALIDQSQLSQNHP